MRGGAERSATASADQPGGAARGGALGGRYLSARRGAARFEEGGGGSGLRPARR